MERMDEYHMARRVLMAGTRETEVRLDGVKVALGNRGMMVETVSTRERSQSVERPGTYIAK